MDRLPQYQASKLAKRLREACAWLRFYGPRFAAVAAVVALVGPVASAILGGDPDPATAPGPFSETMHQCTSTGVAYRLDQASYSGCSDFWVIEPGEYGWVNHAGIMTRLGHNLLITMTWWSWLLGLCIVAVMLGVAAFYLARWLDNRTKAAYMQLRLDATETARRRLYIVDWIKVGVPAERIEVTCRPLDDPTSEPVTYQLRREDTCWVPGNTPPVAWFTGASYRGTNAVLQLGSQLRVMSAVNSFELPVEVAPEDTTLATVWAGVQTLNEH